MLLILYIVNNKKHFGTSVPKVVKSGVVIPT